MRDEIEAIGKGAIGGGIGTALMSVVMLVGRHTGLMSEHPPEAITDAALGANGAQEGDKETRDLLASVLHFAFGIGAGGVFGVIQRWLPKRIHPILGGIGYATLVWATSYQGWIPALGIMPPASDDEPGRPITMILAHWVYGAALGAFVSRADTSRTSPPQGLDTAAMWPGVRESA